MAWEMSQHLHSRVISSLDWYAGRQEDPGHWLASMYADQRWEDETGQAGYDALYQQGIELASLSWDTLLSEVADWSIEQGLTTNGGHEFYVDDWTTIPWCDDEYHDQWWANQ